MIKQVGNTVIGAIHNASCHCGAVELELRLPDGIVDPRRCNCSICRRKGAMVGSVPLADLRILRGADKLSLYQFDTREAEHYFCSICGIYTHHRRRSNPNEYGVNLGCLEEVEPHLIGDVPLLDGANNHPSDRTHPRPRVLLFDIGGVLLDFVGPEGLHRLVDGRHSLDEIRSMWPDSPALSSYELGQSSEAEFARDFVREWQIDLSPDDFLAEFSSWVRAPLDGALELLDDFSGLATLACLSNINGSYWRRIMDEMGFGTRFDHAFASHEVGLLKPDAAIYQHVLQALDCAPAEVVFFDDTRANVDAARALGMRAFLTRGTAELRQVLHQLAHEFSA